MLAAVHVASRGVLSLSVVVAAVAALGCAGGGDQTPASVEDVRPCLEQSAADVISPPGEESFGVALRGSGWTSAGFIRPPAGSVGFLAFYESEDTASDVSDLLKTSRPELLPGFVASKLELHGRAVVMWRLPVRESDRSLVAACLQSDAEASRGTAMDPAKPLGCVQVFLSSETTPAQVQRVVDALHREPLIRNIKFVSKKAALDLMRKKFPELTANLRENPLPDAFRVGPRRGDDVPQLANLVRRYPRAEIVRVSSLPCSLIEPSLTG